MTRDDNNGTFLDVMNNLISIFKDRKILTVLVRRIVEVQSRCCCIEVRSLNRGIVEGSHMGQVVYVQINQSREALWEISNEVNDPFTFVSLKLTLVSCESSLRSSSTE
jgi:hypothetical protein